MVFSLFHHSTVVNTFIEINPDDVRRNIWDEIRDETVDNIEYSPGAEKKIRGASLNKLVEILTSDEAEDKFLKTFLVTYRSFTTPEILLKKLFERFKDIPDEEKWQKQKVTIMLRTGNVLQQWYVSFFHIWKISILG